jgi:hypothetical protein
MKRESDNLAKMSMLWGLQDRRAKKADTNPAAMLALAYQTDV